MKRLARLLVMLICLPTMAWAQADDVATLVADSVTVGDLKRLVAEGNVEVLYGARRLSAPRIVYDSETDRLTVDGPIRLTTGDDSILLASGAELSADLTDGLLKSARMVFDGQLQIAAAEIRRTAGRYTTFDRTVASQCRLCAESETPLWQIRAARVIHDEETRRLRFHHARLEMFGIPVFYTPRLSVPDPSVDRATGFLTPKLQVSDQLGTGLKVPYFITIGPHQDVKVTPYISEETRTLELRYRRAFRNGEIEVQGALSDDRLTEAGTRAFLFAEGAFDLPKDFRLTFDLKTVSDPDYLFDYDYSDENRLENTVSLNRTRRDQLIHGDLAYFEPLRETARSGKNPAATGGLSYRRRFVPPLLGGVAGLTLSTQGDFRASTDATDGDDYDDFGDGMDVGRVSAGLDWRGDHVFGNGLVLAGLGRLDLDYYDISDDTARAGTYLRTTPAIAAELRWPLVKGTPAGARHVLEPIVQLAWSAEDDSSIPDEDSLLLELDEANLTGLNRFPGQDAREAGLRGTLALGWTRHAPAGWSLGATFGRIWRAEDLGQFSVGSGLDGVQSDWLSVIELGLGEELTLWNRALTDDLDITKTDLRLNWTPGRFAMDTTYTWIAADPSEGRDTEVSEWEFAASYRMRDYWTGRTGWRYDAVENDQIEAGVGLVFQNECLTVDLSLSRRFSTSTTDRESTDFGLTVELAGFGAKGNRAAQSRRCTRF